MTRTLLAVAFAAASIAAGCIAPPRATPAARAAGEPPEVALPGVVTGLAVAGHVPFQGGNDVAFHGGHAYVSSSSGVHVVDATDAANPVEVGMVDCLGKDVGVAEVGARVIVTVSFQSDDGCPDASPTGGIRLVDVTDPERPVVGKQVPLRFGSHTHTPYGDSGLVYNSAYNLLNPFDHHRAEIVDVRDPANPVVAGEFAFPASSASHGCHDVLAESVRDRAICAGITETMIWDTSDPLAPRVISTIRNPLISIHHSAATARNGTILVLGDEFAGVLAPGGCATDGRAPTGALWFYDITDASAPRILGYWAPPAGVTKREACTAHNFGVVADRDLVVAGFYTGGTFLVDFSIASAPQTVAGWKEADSNAWAAYYHAGHVFVGDLTRGLDVLRLVGT